MKNTIGLKVTSAYRRSFFLVVCAVILILLGAVAVLPHQVDAAGVLLVVNDASDSSHCVFGECPPCDLTSECTRRDAIQLSNEIGSAYNNIRFDATVFGKPTIIHLTSPLP